MATNIVKPSEFSMGGFVNASEVSSALAIVVENVTRIDEKVENSYEGNISYRDEAVATFTIFNNDAQLKGKQEPVIKANARIAGNGLVRPIKGIVEGGALVGVITKVKAKVGKAWAFEDVDDETLGLVADYLAKRDESREAAADDMPSFD